MQLSSAAEVAVTVLLIAPVWAAGAAWIKACDLFEARRAYQRRSRTRQAMGSARERA